VLAAVKSVDDGCDAAFTFARNHAIVLGNAKMLDLLAHILVVRRRLLLVVVIYVLGLVTHPILARRTGLVRLKSLLLANASI